MTGRACAIFAVILSLVSFQSVAASQDIEKKNIDRAWDEAYKNIGWLARHFHELHPDADATEQFDAYKALMSLVTDNFVHTLYYDTDYPEYLPYLRPEISNYCGPNTDFRYGIVHLEPGANYRVWGTRGNAEALDVQQYAGWAGLKNNPMKATLGEHAQETFESMGIKVDEQGKFEFVLGPTKPEQGQWWPADKKIVALMIRDIFVDHTKEAVPSRIYFEKIGPKKNGPTPPSADEAAERLHAFARSLKEWDLCFKFPEVTAENTYVSKGFYLKPNAKNKDFITSPSANRPKDTVQQQTQSIYSAFYNVPLGQALISEWTPPKELLDWNLQLYTRWLSNPGFMNRQTDINSAAALPDSDGVVRLVISHKDTGIANWVDPDGRSKGIILLRCKLCKGSRGEPTLKLVPENEIMKYLPPDTRMVTPEERERILELRRTHYLMRYQQ